jgi:hypothetical protein
MGEPPVWKRGRAGGAMMTRRDAPNNPNDTRSRTRLVRVVARHPRATGATAFPQHGEPAA